MPAALRPMSVGELLDRCFFLYRKHFLLFVGIAALPHAVLLAVQLGGVVLRSKMAAGFVAWSLLWTLAATVIYLAVLAISQGATVMAVSKVHLDHPAGVAESLASIKGRIVDLSLITIGVGIGIGIGFVLLIIPGIILSLMWALTIPVAVLEDKGLRDSVSRSAELTKGNRGRVFVIYALFLILTYTVMALWEIPILILIGVFTRGHNPSEFPVWSQIAFPVGSFLTQCLVSPLFTIALSLVYYDQRVRKEGFDLELMMSTLDGMQGQTPAPAV
jgi:Membrane domain of glycerophosphoryl diester phosphodiesterase